MDLSSGQACAKPVAGYTRGRVRCNLASRLTAVVVSVLVVELVKLL